MKHIDYNFMGLFLKMRLGTLYSVSFCPMSMTKVSFRILCPALLRNFKTLYGGDMLNTAFWPYLYSTVVRGYVNNLEELQCKHSLNREYLMIGRPTSSTYRSYDVYNIFFISNFAIYNKVVVVNIRESSYRCCFLCSPIKSLNF